MQSTRLNPGLLALLLGSALLVACGDESARTQGPAADSPGKQKIVDEHEELILRALDLARAGEPVEARTLFEEAARTTPDDPRVRRGLRLQKVGPERAAAGQKAREAAEDDLFLGHDLEAWQKLVEARQLDPNDEKIESLYAASCLATRRFQEAWSLFDAIVRSDPTRTDAYLGRAESAFRAEDWTRVVAGLDDLEHRVGSGPADRLLADRHQRLRFLLGVALFKLFRYPEAIEILGKAVAAEPTNINFIEYLANAQLEGGEFEKAAENFRAAIKLDPRLRLARYKLGRAYDRLGRKEEAIKAYEDELSINPREAQVAVECGRCYEILGGTENLQAARRLLLKALELNPLSHDGLFSLQSVERKLGLKEEAEKSNERYLQFIAFKDAREAELRVYQRRRKNDPGDTEAWLATIAIKVRYSQAEEVLDIVREFLNAQPDNVEGIYHMAQLFLVMNKVEDAWFECAKMMELAPRDARGFGVGATALIRLNRHRDALPIARHALTLDETCGDALEALVSALKRLEPDGDELRALLPIYEHMLEQQRLFDEEMKRQREQEIRNDR
ncbi:MAG: tetratricopeptide repeat protein [Planctomycetes bacterium]|nr:tetratricopeptide repeat protein [Planctomycetota bacterium]